VLEPILPEVRHVLEPIVKVHAPILELIIQKPKLVLESTTEDSQPPQSFRKKCDTLW
jgi:hypothetical protein